MTLRAQAAPAEHSLPNARRPGQRVGAGRTGPHWRTMPPSVSLFQGEVSGALGYVSGGRMVIPGRCCAPAPGARGGRELARVTVQLFRLTFKVLWAGSGEGADIVRRLPRSQQCWGLPRPVSELRLCLTGSMIRVLYSYHHRGRKQYTLVRRTNTEID